MKTYEVEYYYYQYNSGLADNGYCVARCKCKSLSVAKKIVTSIKNAIHNRDQNIEPIESTEIKNELIPYAGYFTKPARIFEVTETCLTDSEKSV